MRTPRSRPPGPCPATASPAQCPHGEKGPSRCPRSVGCPAPSVAAAGEPGSAPACRGLSRSPFTCGTVSPRQSFRSGDLSVTGFAFFFFFKFPFKLKLSEFFVTNSVTIFSRCQDHWTFFSAPQTVKMLFQTLENGKPKNSKIAPSLQRECGARSPGPSPQPAPWRVRNIAA